MTTPREWRVCKHHPEVNPETMWGCPDCLAGLRHELAQAIENEGRALKTVDEQADEIGALRGMAALFLVDAEKLPMLPLSPIGMTLEEAEALTDWITMVLKNSGFAAQVKP